jgi:hypothetical protein
MGETGTQPAHREAGPYDEGIAKIIGGAEHIVDRVTNAASRDLRWAACDIVQALDYRFELLSILASLDGFDGGADKLNSVAFEDTVLMQCNRGIQRGLTAERG